VEAVGAVGVVALPREGVARIEVEPRAAAARPTYLVGRMAARLGAGQSAGPRAEEAGRQARACGPGDAADWCAARSIVAAADVMRRDHDLGTAPGLIDAPVLHDVRELSLRPVGVAGVDAEDEVAEIRVEDAG